MANFRPLNNYILYILDKVISKYNLQPPFLDVACGTGYLSKHLGEKGWYGKAIDFSEKAIKITQDNLQNYKKIIVEKKSAYSENGKYKTILMIDLLEHIKEDSRFLKKVHSLTLPGGFLVICVPSNPKEWRWDDDFYGHFRRYTEIELKSKVIKAGFKPFLFYDYTFPFFWGLRRIYTGLKKSKLGGLNKEKQTKLSSYKYAWNMPIISGLLYKTSFFWLPIHLIQYYFFKKKISKGSGIFLLAKK